MDKEKASITDRCNTNPLITSESICPSDYRLRLRAMINKGWCSHSQKLMFGDKSSKEPFTKMEQKVFSDAAKQMEKMDRSERKRIRKQNARIVLIDKVFKNFGNNRCPFCDKTCVMFGILKPSCFQCFYCKRTMCKTRGVEMLRKEELYWSCYICLEKIKIWSMSGEWFFKACLPDKLFKENRTVPEELEFVCLRRPELLTSTSTGENMVIESSSSEESESETETEEQLKGKLGTVARVPRARVKYNQNVFKDEFILSGLSSSCSTDNIFTYHFSKRTKQSSR